MKLTPSILRRLAPAAGACLALLALPACSSESGAPPHLFAAPRPPPAGACLALLALPACSSESGAPTHFFAEPPPDPGTPVRDAAAPDVQVADASVDAPPDHRDVPDTSAPDTGAPDAPDTAPPDTDGDGTTDALDCAPTDPSRWQMLAYGYRDADDDGYTVTSPGTVCAGNDLPAGYSQNSSGDDCDDANPAVYQSLVLYADTDGDTVGAGAGQVTCVGAIPAGFSTTGTDCAPTDASLYQLSSYAYRDADGDGYTRAQTGQVCSGASLPAGYLTQANGDDCDDANRAIFALLTLYADTDKDGVGAGAASQACTDGTTPAGFSTSDTDCAPADPNLWQTLTYSFVDRDGDGATVPASGSLCAGASLPLPYSAVAHGNDCDDTNAALTHWDVLWPDKDADGAGGGAYVFRCDGAAIPAGLSRYGDDEDDGNAAIGPLAPEDLLDLFN